MTKATYINLGEVQSGNVAVDKATDSSIKQYGNMMITDHSAADLELANIALSKNVVLPNDTDQEHKDIAMMLAMLQAAAFDSTYIYMMVTGHDKAITLHQDEAQNAQDQALKN